MSENNNSSNGGKKYIEADRFEHVTGNIYERMNVIDAKHTKQYYELQSRFERYSVLQEEMRDQQKETNQSIQDLTKVMTRVGEDMTKAMFRIEQQDEKLEGSNKRIEKMEGAIDGRQQGVLQLIGTVVTAASVIIAAAFAFAQVFF